LVDGIFPSAKEAGRQLVNEGGISEESKKKLARIDTKDAYYKAAKEMIEQVKKQKAQ